MSKDLGTQGGRAAAPTYDPDEAGVPTIGFDAAPKAVPSAQTTYCPPGIGGSNPGAH